MSAPNYTYIDSAEYINNLEFDYIETYSLQRGPDFEQNVQAEKKKFNDLKIKKDLSKSEALEYTRLNGLYGFTQYLLNENGEFHPSSKLERTFKKDAKEIVRLTEILNTPITEKPRMLCAPVYRDAIVFYDQADQIVSVLNVCLSCCYMETKKFNHINGDFLIYDLLKRFFLDIGHKVEKPDYFIWDDIQKMISKNGNKR